MKVVKDSSGNAVIYPFLAQGSNLERLPAFSSIQVEGDLITVNITSALNEDDPLTIQDAIQVLKALQEAISIAQVNRHQAQLTQGAKAVQE